jgi:NADH-quinone oxidoreductase subunit L
MLEAVWIIPALPAVSFVVILFFGKRLPKKGAEVIIAAVGAAFVLSCVTAVEWISRVNDAPVSSRRVPSTPPPWSLR